MLLKKIISVLPWNMGVSAKFVIYLLMYIFEIGKQKYNFETKAVHTIMKKSWTIERVLIDVIYGYCDQSPSV